jgi:hypothetical protein
MNRGPTADAALIKGLVDEAMKPQGFERLGRSRWLCASPEILWVIEADRGASWSRWAVMVGAIVKAWAPDVASPHASDGHLVTDYAYLTSAVPEAAVGTRFDDHVSYFSQAFDHQYWGMEVDERRAAMAFMADDIAHFCRANATLDDVALLISSGRVGGFVHRRLREYATSSVPIELGDASVLQDEPHA